MSPRKRLACETCSPTSVFSETLKGRGEFLLIKSAIAGKIKHGKSYFKMEYLVLFKTKTGD